MSLTCLDIWIKFSFQLEPTSQFPFRCFDSFADASNRFVKPTSQRHLFGNPLRYPGVKSVHPTRTFKSAKTKTMGQGKIKYKKKTQADACCVLVGGGVVWETLHVTLKKIPCLFCCFLLSAPGSPERLEWTERADWLPAGRAGVGGEGEVGAVRWSQPDSAALFVD